MDELKRKRLENQVIEQLRQKGFLNDSFDTIIKIYIDLLMQKEALEQQLHNCDVSPERKTILSEVLASLNEDIQAYHNKLNL